eukprot:XP_002261242.1 hypothetical protein, conserved in Plasmodium species [Plasmodium knowlesi strain H]
MVGEQGKALFYLSNHADNICSVKFCGEDEGSVKLWDINRNHCAVKLDTNNYTYAKPYSVNGNIITPVNHNGDIAIYDLRMQTHLPRNNTLWGDSNEGSSNTLVIRFNKIKKSVGKMKMMTSQFVSSFIIDVKENVLSYHINKNKCVVSSNNNSVYSLTLGKGEQVCLVKKAQWPKYNMSNLVIRSDNKVFISITNNCSVNLCDLHQMEILDCIKTYKFNYFNFVDFHPFSGLFAVAERNKVSIWANQASSFDLPPSSDDQSEVVPLG